MKTILVELVSNLAQAQGDFHAAFIYCVAT
jgi:hypothetical protein